MDLPSKILSDIAVYMKYARYLPKKNVWRKKAGFGAPIGSWINNQLKDMVLDLLSEDSINRRGYFNYKSINILLNQHFSGYNYNANQIWQLLILETRNTQIQKWFVYAFTSHQYMKNQLCVHYHCSYVL